MVIISHNRDEISKGLCDFDLDYHYGDCK